MLYLVANSEVPFKQAIISLLFFSGWFVFANCESASSCWGLRPLIGPLVIMFQMFIAVINEVGNVVSPTQILC